MALKWLEGFDASINTTHLARTYNTMTGTITQAAGASETGGVAITSDDALFTTKPFSSVENTWIIGLAFRSHDDDKINNPDIPYVAMRNGDGEQIRFEFFEELKSKPGGNLYRIRVMRGAVELATSVEGFFIADNSPSLWVFFEFKVTIDNATGEFSGQYQFTQKPSISDVPIALTWDAANTGVDTQNQATTGADRFSLSMITGNSVTEVAVDDIYVCDSTGTKNNDFIGKILIEEQKPLAAGATDEWVLADAATLNEAWDETISEADDDPRVTSQVPTDITLATVDPLVALIAPGTTIIGVRHDIVARMETTGDLDIAHFFRKTTGTPAETDAGTALNVDSTTYEASAAVLEDDPNTLTDWDIADLNSYQYGVRNDG